MTWELVAQISVLILVSTLAVGIVLGSMNSGGKK